MSDIRAFIGIDFEEQLKNEIYKLQQRLKRYATRGRWKNIDNFHLTLKFLNEINWKQQQQIDRVMREICTGRKPFTLSLEGLGVFDGRDMIRVIWLGLSGDIRELGSLQKAIDNALTIIGFLPEKRRYSPHITVGQDIVFECPFEQIREVIGDVRLCPVNVEKLYLFKSEQVQNKRIYTRVTEYDMHLLSSNLR